MASPAMSGEAQINEAADATGEDENTTAGDPPPLPAEVNEDLFSPKSPSAEDKEIVEEEKKEVVEELRGLADDRLKSIVAAAVGSYQELQGEVRRLQKRIEELESRLSSFVGRKESEKGAESKADAKAAESKAAESKAAESGDTDAAADEEG